MEIQISTMYQNLTQIFIISCNPGYIIIIEINMKKVIGIRKEDKSCWQRRTPLTPTHVAALLQEMPGLRILVQSSKIRIYNDHQYQKAGAEIVASLEQCSLIMGIKEIPIDKFIEGKTFMFFSHTHKGQPYNMKALKTILEKKVRLIDYELISDDKGRLIAFGEYAGIAGAIDFLTGLGWTLINRRISSQFLLITNSYTYANLEEAYTRIGFAGKLMAQKKIDESLLPMVFTVTGTGRTAAGVLRVIENLPHKRVSVTDLPNLPKDPSTIFICQVDSSDVMEDGDGKYDKKDYKAHPEKYRCTFEEKVLPYTSCLYQCIYWEATFPRYLTRKGLRDLALKQNPLKLLGVCDVSCDLEGSLEMTSKFTTPDDPYFMYDPIEMKEIDRLAPVPNKIMYMTLDFLPCQLANDASSHFSNKLKDFVPQILASNPDSHKVEEMNLPGELSRAVVAANGFLADKFKDLHKDIEKHG